MKKSAFLSLVCTLFVLTTFTSCSMSPDMMLEQYNGKLYEDIGGGIYITDGKPNINVHLLPFDTYRVMTQNFTHIEAEEGYLEYTWILTDNETGKKKTLSKCYFVNIEAAVLNLIKDGNYSIELYVTNRNNVLFMDKATLIVVQNIYN